MPGVIHFLSCSLVDPQPNNGPADGLETTFRAIATTCNSDKPTILIPVWLTTASVTVSIAEICIDADRRLEKLSVCVIVKYCLDLFLFKV